jgi:hypothetical protein
MGCVKFDEIWQVFPQKITFMQIFFLGDQVVFLLNRD